MPPDDAHDIDEHSIIIAFKQGDKAAFKYIYDLSRAHLFDFVKGVVNDPYATENILAQSYIALFKKRQYINSMAQIKAALMLSSRQLCLRHHLLREDSSLAASDAAQYLKQLFASN